jgi:hypothetical protein
VPGLFLRMRFVSPGSLHLGRDAVLIIASIEYALSILMGSGGFGELGSILSFIMPLNATRSGLTNGLVSVSSEIEPGDQDAPVLSYRLVGRGCCGRAPVLTSKRIDRDHTSRAPAAGPRPHGAFEPRATPLSDERAEENSPGDGATVR